MIDNVQLLNSISSSADMARDSLNHIIDKATDSQLKKVLQTQVTEYDNIYNQADNMLRAKGKSAQKSPAMLKAYSHIVSNMKTLSADNATSTIAEMVIQGSTMGVTEITKQLNDYMGDDKESRSLAEKQLKTEQENIEQMKRYL